MTKEELEKEAEKHLKQKLEERKDKFVFELPEVYIKDVKEAYLAGAKPREKRIAELEKENKVLSQNLEDTEIINNALEKENAELKEELKDANKKVVHLACNQNKDLKRKINKAKELLKRCYENYIYLEPLRSEIKQFISEVEK